MELKNNKISHIFQKYKYVILVAMIGIVLMLMPTTKNPQQTETKMNVTAQGSIQQELENILSQIDGAGTVRVLLKERTGAETIYQTNEDISDGGSGSKIETVIVTDANRNESGLVIQVNPPQYTGAIVLCQGAENSSVKYAVADAVSKVTGLGLDKIAVLKMK